MGHHKLVPKAGIFFYLWGPAIYCHFWSSCANFCIAACYCPLLYSCTAACWLPIAAFLHCCLLLPIAAFLHCCLLIANCCIPALLPVDCQLLHSCTAACWSPIATFLHCCLLLPIAAFLHCCLVFIGFCNCTSCHPLRLAHVCTSSLHFMRTDAYSQNECTNPGNVKRTRTGSHVAANVISLSATFIHLHLAYCCRFSLSPCSRLGRGVCCDFVPTLAISQQSFFCIFYIILHYFTLF